MSELIGKTLGSYQIIEQIGMGGMATVYKAYQASMDRYVAIKVLPRQLAEDPQFIGRFHQEAQTIAKLENKHILRVYDYGEQEGQTYLVMRYVGSGTLKDLTERGPLPLLTAVEYFSQLADALQYAHDHGVIHRDVKTSNVLLGDSDDSYLTDFGIAKLAESAAHFTGTGSIIGTPAYMSPEQGHGFTVDARSDIYSLGVVLYEMLTGVVPFEAETPIAVVLKHVNEPLPSPRRVNAMIPESVEKVVFRALAKNPDERYQSAREFGEALRAATVGFTEKDTMPLPAPTPAPARVEAAYPPTKETLAPPTQRSAPTRPMPAERERSRVPLIAGAAVVGVVALVIVVALLMSGGDDGKVATATGAPVTEAAVVATPTSSPAAATLTPSPQPTLTEPVSSATPAPTAPPPPTPSTPPTVPVWTNFTSTGESDGSNRQLVAAANGLWMSSLGGLVHWTYDGVPTKYTGADGLIFNDIGAMALDSAGALWLGGAGDEAGVMRLDLAPDGGIADILTFDQDNSGLRSSYIWNFVPAPDGTMLAGAYESLLEWWDGQGWGAPDAPVDEVLQSIGDRTWALIRTQDGTLWAGGPDGFVRTRGDTWEQVALPDALLAMEQESYGIVGLYEDPLDGAIWVAILTTPEYGLHLWRLVPPAPDSDAAEWTWQPTEDWVPDGLNHILRASDNALWLVGYDTVIRVAPDTGRRAAFNSDQGIVGGRYLHLVEDPTGAIWLSTDRALHKYDGRRWVPFVIPNEPETQDIQAMAEADDGTLWFAADYSWILTYREGVWETVEDLGSDLTAIATQGNAVWVGTDSGVVRWQNGAVRRYAAEDGLTDPRVSALALDATDPDTLWIGTLNGLNRLNTADGTLATWTVDNGLPSQEVTALYFDSDGVLWVGTGYYDSEADTHHAGLARMDGETLTVVGAQNAPFQEDDAWVLAIEQDSAGNLWVGTDDHLFRYDGSAWRLLRAEDGAPDGDSIWGIVADGDTLWVATGYSGLYRLDSIGWYRVGHGATGSSYFRGLRQTSDGALWILGEDGITRLVGDPLVSGD
jgi:serine/threonine protein kinase